MIFNHCFFRGGASLYLPVSVLLSACLPARPKFLVVRAKLYSPNLGKYIIGVNVIVWFVCLCHGPYPLVRPPEVDLVPGIQMLKPKCACQNAGKNSLGIELYKFENLVIVPAGHFPDHFLRDFLSNVPAK